MSRKMIITIDGPAGAGKSTVSKTLAAKFSYIYLDTGALYRAFAFRAKEEGIAADDVAGLSAMGKKLRLRLQYRDDNMIVITGGKDITEEIRTEEIGLLASAVSAQPCVRQALLSLQREAAALGGVVAEGRDMGTVVFPEADCKFFLDADVAARAMRRYKELTSRNGPYNYESVEKDMVRRDRQDSERDMAPLKPAHDAVIIDSTHMTVMEVVDKISEIIKIRMGRSAA